MDNLEKALQGSKKELMALYSKTEDKVFKLALALTEKKDGASKITSQVLSSLFSPDALKAFKSYAELEKTAVNKTVLAAKQEAAKENNRAFRLPKDMNFISEADPEGKLADSLSPITRFIYVVTEVFGADLEVVCTATKFDKKTLLTAQNQLKEHFETVDPSESKRKAFKEELDSLPLPAELEKTRAPIIAKLCAARKEKNKRIILASAAVVFCIAIIAVVVVAAVIAAQNPIKDGILVKPTMDFDPAKEYYAEIDIKDLGKITVKLEPDSAPITVSNFIELARDGFYDNVGFHRIINGFMMQGGSPDGSANGGPERRIKGEFSSNGIDNPLKHTRGAISMARTSVPDSAGSQFFIMHQDKTHLDGDYAVFGYVTEGIEIVDEICGNASAADTTIPPEDRPVMNTVKIIVKDK